MGTILVGYDTETAAVGEALCLFTESPNFPLYELALDPETCREALDLLTEVHADVGVPATLFVCGRTLLHALDKRPIQAPHHTDRDKGDTPNRANPERNFLARTVPTTCRKPLRKSNASSVCISYAATASS